MATANVRTTLEVHDHHQDSPIGALSRELLELIFEFIYNTSPWTLSSLTLVNKTFYASALKDQRSRKSQDILGRLLADPAKKHILLSTRSITVVSTQKQGNWRVATLYEREYKNAYEKKWLSMADLLSKVPNLKNFTLQGTDQLPAALIDTLKTFHPQAHLHVENWTRVEDGEDHNNAAEIALAHSPNLQSLQARLSSTSSHIDLRQEALKRIVALSPKLECLDVYEGSLGLLARNITVEEQQEQTRIREKFREDVVPSSNSIRSLRSRGANHMIFLKDVPDTTQLHTLDVGYVEGDTASLLSLWQESNFTQLKCLSFALKDSAGLGVYEVMGLFLQACPSLESLSITDGANYIPLSTILSHGATLRSLGLHEVESAISDVERSISIREVQWLSERCKILEDITVDAGKTSTAEDLNEVLSTLATFPLLHTIRIYIPLGVAEEAARTPHIFLDEDETRAEIETYRTNPFNPIEDSCWLENAWALLRYKKKMNGHTPLRELHVKVGEWEREMSGGYPAGWVIWEAANRRYYTATPHERDDRPDDINVHIRGTKPYSNVDSHEIRRLPNFVDLCDSGLQTYDRGLNHEIGRHSQESHAMAASYRDEIF